MNFPLRYQKLTKYAVVILVVDTRLLDLKNHEINFGSLGNALYIYFLTVLRGKMRTRL